MALHSAVSDTTAHIVERSRPDRSAYLAQLDADSNRAPSMDRMGCANVAHALAGMPLDDRFKIVTERGVVYMMGRVTQREGQVGADVARGVSGVTKVVKMFEYIPEEEMRALSPKTSKVEL